MFCISGQNGHLQIEKNAMLIKITGKDIIHYVKGLSLLSCVEICLQMALQVDTITAMIDDLYSKVPSSRKLSKRRNIDSHLLNPFDTSLKGFYTLRARVSDHKEKNS
jgi:hypothetical protein